MNRSLCWTLLLIVSAAVAQPNADTIWTRTYGTSEHDETLYSGVAVEDGGFLLIGNRDFDLSPLPQGSAVRTNALGDTLWTLSYPDADSGYAVFGGACESVGGFLITGAHAMIDISTEELLLMRVDNTGEIFWTWQGVVGDLFYGVAVRDLPNGLIAVAGYQYGTPAMLLLEPESGETTLLLDPFSGSWLSMDVAEDGIVLGGIAYGFAGPMMYYRKYDFEGSVMWEGMIARTGIDEIHSIIALDNGGAVAVGCVNCSSIASDSYYLEIDNGGEIVVEENIGTEDREDGMNHISVTPTGSSLLTGWVETEGTGTDMFAKVYDSELGMAWEGVYGGDGDDAGVWGIFREDGRIYLAGHSAPSPELSSDLYLVAIDTALASGVENPSPALPAELTLTAYPNPFNASTSISFTLPIAGFVNIVVYDLLGREVALLANQEYSASEHVISFDGSDLASGIYTATLNANGQHSATRLVLLK